MIVIMRLGHIILRLSTAQKIYKYLVINGDDTVRIYDA